MLKMLKKVFLSIFVIVLVGVVWFGYGGAEFEDELGLLCAAYSS